MRARLHASRARRGRRRPAAGPPPPISTPAGRGRFRRLASAARRSQPPLPPDARRARPPPSAASAEDGCERRRPAPARSRRRRACVDRHRAVASTLTTRRSRCRSRCASRPRREDDIGLVDARLAVCRRGNVSDAPVASSEIVTTGVSPSRGSTPCCLTMISGVHVPPARRAVGQWLEPDGRPAACERRSRSRRARATSTETTTRMTHGLLLPRLPAAGTPQARGRGPSAGYRAPSGSPSPRPSAEAPVPRFHVRCHQTKNAAERMIASAGDVHVQANAAELVRRVDAEHLDPEAADAVEEHVEGEQATGADPGTCARRRGAPRPPRSSTAPRTGTSGGTSRSRRRRSGGSRGRSRGPTAGRSARRTAPGSTSSRSGRCPARRAAPGATQSASVATLAPGALRDDRADDDAEPDAAPDAEAALPDRERPPPLVRQLVPARDHVVQARADDPERDAPDRDPEDEIPVAAAPRPADPGDDDGRRDRDEERQAVEVDGERPELERARARARESTGAEASGRAFCRRRHRRESNRGSEARRNGARRPGPASGAVPMRHGPGGGAWAPSKGESGERAPRCSRAAGGSPPRGGRRRGSQRGRSRSRGRSRPARAPRDATARFGLSRTCTMSSSSAADIPPPFALGIGVIAYSSGETYRTSPFRGDWVAESVNVR